MTVADASAVAADGVAVPAPPAVRFVGDPRAYWRLLARGSALLAVTLGIYRFWFATDIRRFLWSNTEAAGETLEYTGTATELLIGFLIAIAVLIPLNVALALATLSAGPIGELASTLTFPILFFLGQFAIYRARRYRLTRTVYRGIRCHQTGSALRYAVCAVFWWSMIVLTLGLAYPLAQSRLERFKMRNTWYGDLQGRFEGSSLRLLLRGFPMWLLVVGPLAGAVAFAVATVDWDKVAAAAASSSGGSEFINQLEGASPAVYSAIVVALAAVSISIVMTAVLFPVFQAMVLRWWLAGLRFGELTIHSHLRTSHIYGAYLRFLWYGLLLLVVIAIVGSIGYVVLGLMLVAIGNADTAEAVNAAAMIGLYVVTMLGFSAIYQGTVKLSLWRSGVESIVFEGLDVLDRVKAQGAASSAVGEGLADALNVGGI